MIDLDNISDKELKKISIDDLTHMFMDSINEQTIKLIEGGLL